MRSTLHNQILSYLINLIQGIHVWNSTFLKNVLCLFSTEKLSCFLQVPGTFSKTYMYSLHVCFTVQLINIHVYRNSIPRGFQAAVVREICVKICVTNISIVYYHITEIQLHKKLTQILTYNQQCRLSM